MGEWNTFFKTGELPILPPPKIYKSEVLDLQIGSGRFVDQTHNGETYFDVLTSREDGDYGILSRVDTLRKNDPWVEICLTPKSGQGPQIIVKRDPRVGGRVEFKNGFS